MVKQAWIFDLDGTLTAPMHDFGALKRELGLPADRDVLAGIATLPEKNRPAAHRAVRVWERRHIENARPAVGARGLLEAIRGRRGILTRNTRETALETLEAIGLRSYFDDDDVLGRDCAPAKPAPDGLLLLLNRWGVAPHDAVMVGDYVHDLQAARAAEVFCVWIDPEGTGHFSAEADLTVLDLTELYSGW